MSADQSAITVHTATRRAYARMESLNHGVVRTFGALAVLGFVSAGAAVTWTLHELKTSASKVERYVVVLDHDYAPVGRSALQPASSMPPGAYLFFAREWVRQLRERVREISIAQVQADSVRDSTDGRLYGQLLASIKEENELAGGAAVKVLEVVPSFQDPENPVVDNAALIIVQWTQQVDTAAAKRKTYRATLKVVYAPGGVSNEYALSNLLRLYTTSFSPTLISES